jgi:CubicO group peptidase (beta-lactamase class C family)
MSTDRRIFLQSAAAGIATLLGQTVMAASTAPSSADTGTDESFPLLGQLAVRDKVDAVTLAIVRARRLAHVHMAVGRETPRSPDRHTIFHAASLSKPLFSYVVFRLIDQGVIELDAPVMNYLPDTMQEYVRGVLQRSEPEVAAATRLELLTVRMLLNHTSGLPNLGKNNNRDAKFNAVPGTRWEYSGIGFQLLQKAVEKTTGELLNPLATRLAFEPLNMHRSSFVPQSSLDPNVAQGTAKDGTPVETKMPPDAYAAFSLRSTAEDYGKFLAAVLRDEHMLEKIAGRTTPVNPELGFHWGLGWGIEQRGEERLIWQWGNTNGYRAFVMGSLLTGDGFVMLTNSDNGLPMARPLAEKILPGEHPIFRHAYLRS